MAVYETITIEKLHIDLSMSNILNEYPIEHLPNKLNKRTGKAKNCPFENIDLKMYEESAHMITFHTSLPRLQYWIKALSILYYENLGKLEGVEIKWSDIPEKWSDRNDTANSIFIEVETPDGTLIYNVTLFVSTGTIRVQGSRYRLFTDKYFPILQTLLKQVITHNSSESDQSIQQVEELSASQEDNTGVKELFNDDINNNTSIIAKDQLEILEESFLGAIKKLENAGNTNKNELLTEIKECHSLLNKQSRMTQDKTSNKQLETDMTTLHQQIRNLQDERESLKSQLKLEKGNCIIIRTQYEDALKHEKQMLAETRNELKNLVATNNSEIETIKNRLDEKNTEIDGMKERFDEKNKALDKAQDEILNLKTQLSSSMDREMKTQGTPNRGTEGTKQDVKEKSDVRPNKPVALLVGTSNVRNINEDKMTPDVTVIKHISFTLEETQSYIMSCNPTFPPDLVVLHSLTNDIKSITPQKCVEEMDKTITIIRSKWNETGVIISLTTPRIDVMNIQTNGQITNALLKQHFGDRKFESYIYLIDHHNMLYEGYPNKDLLKTDGYHLNEKGVSHLALNIKKALHYMLNIPLPLSRRSRSKSNTRIPRSRNEER